MHFGLSEINKRTKTKSFIDTKIAWSRILMYTFIGKDQNSGLPYHPW